MARTSGCILLFLFVCYLTQNSVFAQSRCGGDPHAVLGCYPDYCDSVCFRPSSCPETCGSRLGCQCASGYKLDANKLYCVPEEQCTQPIAMPINEEGI